MSLPTPFAAFWSELGVDRMPLSGMLGTAVIETSVHGDVSAAAFADIAAAFGLPTAAYGSIHLAITDDYLQSRLDEVNRSCLSRGIPMLIVKPVGVKIWIGPLIVPGSSACWKCLEPRLVGNREVETFILRKTGRNHPLPLSRARVGLLENHACVMAVLQIARYFGSGGISALENRLLVADLMSFAFDFHPVVRRPQCPACGVSYATIGKTAVKPSSAPVASVNETGSRAESPEFTFHRLQHHISPLTGIVKVVEPSLWHGQGPLRVYVAGHNFALKNDELYFLKDGLRTHSSGKGRTDAQARTSALCEALERFSGLYQGNEPRVTARMQDLSDSIDPTASMLFSERQYRERDRWLARQTRFQVVPLPFDESAVIDWTPVWSLTQQRRRYLPTSYLFYNAPCPPEHFYCWADSNGAAAGTTLDEALLQGLLEVVERDAVAIWWYNRLSRPAVDLQAFDPEFAAELQEFYGARGREVWALDVTTDVGIPAFVALTRRLDGPTEDIIMGFGAHLDSRVALNRALTEMNQFSPAVLSVLADGSTAYGVHDHEAITWWRTATLSNQPYLAPDLSPPRTPAHFDANPVMDAGKAVAILQAKLETLGHEVLVLNQSRPEIGLPVVKAIVPGMRHFWARFAPGRLYDVPIRMGLLEKPTAEIDLNPTAMFL
jgi:oxazoline/thiazoline synthase